MAEKICYKCKESLDILSFSKDITHNDNHRSICKNCEKIRDKRRYWDNREDSLAKSKIYYQNNKEELKMKSSEYYYDNKEKVLLRLCEYRNKDETKKKRRIWDMKNKESKRISDRKYFKTEKGRISHKKANAIRRRNLKFIPLFENPFPEEIEVDYHHINNILVIPLPRSLHKNNLGKYHKQKCNNIINSIFLLDVNKLLMEDV